MNNFKYEIANDTATITGYTGAGGAVTIPSTVDGLPVTAIGYQAFECCHGLTSITLPNSITAIDAYAFVNCIGLTSITLGNNITIIGARAFYGC